VRVRLGDADDTDAAIAVWKASREARDAGVVTSADRERRARDDFSRPDSFLVVAEDDRVVGMALAMHTRDGDGSGPVVPGRCHVEMVFVTPDRWGTGIGARVLDGLLDEACARRYESIELWTGIDNERAQRLYESRGFVRSGQEQDTETGDRIVQYERPLGYERYRTPGRSQSSA